MAKKEQQNVAVENIEAVTKTEAIIDKYKKHIVYGICAIIVIAAATYKCHCSKKQRWK